jgi:uncharacterized protein YprB with RNaseH-like and TPR domain
VPWENLPDHRRKWYRDAALASLEILERLVDHNQRDVIRARTVRVTRTPADVAD